ncbi:hypothetical protein LWC34_00900 [Kibdelosporangium philippinense]|uniref:DUF1540 domain-containing protein n=1 Tax=Kibdelosporangium philippinense TaxID=211113 RepID=A0ABS8Z3P6_9PSEU|nr:hypothetical protein [Kibdelosporangium philippinense]MCE7001405.1 hypothetical protein [Kibdelosporangium philippinense]
MISTECVLCSRGIDHCHGSLVVHSDGTAECTDITCLELGIGTHELVLECAQLTGGCECAEVRVTA